mgnify:CR=1 FL=1
MPRQHQRVAKVRAQDGRAGLERAPVTARLNGSAEPSPSQDDIAGQNKAIVPGRHKVRDRAGSVARCWKNIDVQRVPERHGPRCAPKLLGRPAWVTGQQLGRKIPRKAGLRL